MRPDSPKGTPEPRAPQSMQRHLAALTIALLLSMVLVRVAMLRRQGVRAMNFGKQDKTDYLIPPFAFFYFYLVFAHAFGWPTVARQQLFASDVTAWLGVAFCLAGLLLLFWSLVSFGRSFRVGIDDERPDKLVTDGIFAVSRNPIYVAFWSILLGQFLVFPNWILLAYLVGATLLFHRQVRREEAYLAQHYGSEYADYGRRVRRYL
jgi:protein-S-isoprenylcysteine O-methyltransferase Ste14